MATYPLTQNGPAADARGLLLADVGRKLGKASDPAVAAVVLNGSDAGLTD